MSTNAMRAITIKKVNMNCPVCDKVHEVEERKRKTSITIKGEEVTYEEKFYFCENADGEENEFEMQREKEYFLHEEVVYDKVE